MRDKIYIWGDSMQNSTKQLLANSLKELLNKKSFNKITISDITDNAKLNRKTFYYHFKDIYELVESIYINDIIEELNTIDTYENWQQVYLFITEYILKNKKFIISTYKLSPLNKFIYKHTNKMILNVLNKKVKGNDLTTKDKEFVSKFYSYAIVGTLGDWIENGMKETSKQMIDRIDKIIEKYIKNID